MNNVEEAPFRYLLPGDRVPARGMNLRIEADAEAREAVARFLDVLEVLEMAAEFHIQPVGKTAMFRVNGRLTARVIQSCVVTLAPVESSVEEEVSMTFAPQEEAGEAGEEEIELDFHEADPPDPMIDGGIDLGAVMVEHLALGLDPFPRAHGASFEAPGEPEPEPAAKANPFAALAGLKQKR